MRRANRYCLSRIQPKMSWAAPNIYNMLKFTPLQDKNLDIYATQWKSKTLCRLYFNGDVTHKYFRKLFQENYKNIYTTLASNERRLDNALFRSGLVNSIYQARKLISSGKVYINGDKRKSPSYLLQNGELVSLNPPTIIQLIKESLNNPFRKFWGFCPPYLEVNYPTLSFVFLRTPQYHEIPHPFPRSMIESFAGFYQTH